MLPQIIANTIVSASLVFMLASGFSLIYRVTRCFHFAHAAVFASGAYFVFIFYRVLGVPLPVSVVLAVLSATLLGVLIELAVYRPLRRKRSSSLTIMLASLGVYVVLQNLISLCFGDAIHTVRSRAVMEGVSILGAKVTPTQVFMIAGSCISLLALVLILGKTRLGQAMRAVASDEGLARVSGIESNHLFVWTIALGSALAGLAGILMAFDVDMTPGMGMNIFMLGLAAVIVGGIGSSSGVALGSLILGISQQFGAWGTSSEWQEAIAFLILLTFLLVRPEGIMGHKLRKATA